MTRITSLSRTGLTAALAVAFAGIAATASAAPPAGDTAFMKKAAAGGMAEVELSKVAQQKGSSDGVKQFAAKMIEDHTKANEELMQIAGTKSVALPTAPDAKHQQMMAKLQTMSGDSFDRAYMAGMLADHKETVALFEKEAKGGRDADAKAFAAKTLPALKDHLKMVQDMNGSMKK